jgi:hypothetical protein
VRLASEYLDVDDRCVTPLDTERGRIGIAYQLADGSVLRVAVTREHALELSRLLHAYCKSPAGTQSDGSSLNPSEPRSVPSEGVKV